MSAPGPARRAEVTRDDWETPQELFDLLDMDFGGFDLDGAANDKNHKCPSWLGPGGLVGNAFEWEPNDHVPMSIWCNPPYGKALGDWMAIFRAWARSGHTVVALVPNSTDCLWFRTAAQDALEVRLLTGRVQFVGTTSSNPSGSAIFVFAPGLLTAQPDGAVIRMWDWKR